MEIIGRLYFVAVERCERPPNSGASIRITIYTHVLTSMYIHAYVYICKYTYTYAYIDMHIHIYICLVDHLLIIEFSTRAGPSLNLPFGV